MKTVLAMGMTVIGMLGVAVGLYVFVRETTG